MRPTLLLSLLLLAAPAQAEMRDIESCSTRLAEDPAAAREEAARWLALGGGTPARICQAFAIEATGAIGTAAEQLTEIAQDPRAGLAQPERAALLDRASLLWSDLGQSRLARLTAENAARIAPSDARQARLLTTLVAMEDWPALIAAKGVGSRPTLHARALIELDRLEEAEAVLAATADGPASAIEHARLIGARGEASAALAALARIETDDPRLTALRQALIQQLLQPKPLTAPRPMPRRP